MKLFPIKDLKRADYNPRVMPESEMASLMLSIETHGFVEPIVVNISKDRYGTIVGGHQRLTAVEKILMKEVPVRGVEYDAAGFTVIPAFEVELGPEAEKQLNIALNRIRGRFDEDKLFSMIVGMKESATLPATGFREDEISRILDMNMPDLEADDPMEPPKEPKSKLGDMYDLGPHRLVCGDSTDPATYAKLLGESKADMIWTDPPYNIDYEGKTADKMKIKNDRLTPPEFRALIDGAFKSMLGACRAGAAMYICSGWASYPQFLESMLKSGFHHSGVIIWAKNSPTLGFSDYRHKHEWIARAKKAEPKAAEAIIYGWRDGTHEFHGRDEFDVWEMPRRSSNRSHPTEKPDWLIMRALRNSSKRGDAVLDPFGGSGSLMAACEKTGRRALMIELDPRFCDVIRARWDAISAKNKKDGE